MKFFKILITGKNNSDQSNENNSNISSRFKYLKNLINYGDIPKL